MMRRWNVLSLFVVGVGCSAPGADLGPIDVRPLWPPSGAIMSGPRIAFEVATSGRDADKLDEVSVELRPLGTAPWLTPPPCRPSAQGGGRFVCEVAIGDPIPPAIEWRAKARRRIGPDTWAENRGDGTASPWRIEVPQASAVASTELAHINAFTTAPFSNWGAAAIRISRKRLPPSAGEVMVATCARSSRSTAEGCPHHLMDLHVSFRAEGSASLRAMGDVNGDGHPDLAMTTGGRVDVVYFREDGDLHNGAAAVACEAFTSGSGVVAVTSVRDVDVQRAGAERASARWAMEGWASLGASDFVVATPTELHLCKGRRVSLPVGASCPSDRTARCQVLAALPDGLLSTSPDAAVKIAALNDIDGDDLSEVVVGTKSTANHPGAVAVFYSASGRWRTLGAAFDGRTLAIGGDVDGDGYRDLAYTTNAAAVVVYPWASLRYAADGAGTAAEPLQFRGRVGYGESIVGADIHQRGRWATLIGEPARGKYAVGEEECGAIHVLECQERTCDRFVGLTPLQIHAWRGDHGFGSSFAVIPNGRQVDLVVFHAWEPETGRDGNPIGQETIAYSDGSWTGGDRSRSAFGLRCLRGGAGAGGSDRPGDLGPAPSTIAPGRPGEGSIATPSLLAPNPADLTIVSRTSERVSAATPE